MGFGLGPQHARGRARGGRGAEFQPRVFPRRRRRGHRARGRPGRHHARPRRARALGRARGPALEVAGRLRGRGRAGVVARGGGRRGRGGRRVRVHRGGRGGRRPRARAVCAARARTGAFGMIRGRFWFCTGPVVLELAALSLGLFLLECGSLGLPSLLEAGSLGRALAAASLESWRRSWRLEDAGGGAGGGWRRRLEEAGGGRGPVRLESGTVWGGDLTIGPIDKKRSQ